MSETQTTHLNFKGQLKGHSGWVTCLATSAQNPNILVSGSRDKSLIVWELTKDQTNYGYPKRALIGHSHFISDVVISADAQFAISSSWDKTLRLWELSSGKTNKSFVDHEKDVTSVTWSSDNRQIVSASRDKSIKLWNTLGECKFTIAQDNGHENWVSCVRFAPGSQSIVSASWDKSVRVWNLASCKCMQTLLGHSGYINSVTISPDGSLCASGGKDGVAMLWDLHKGEHLYSLKADNVIHSLTFSPNRYWLCAATDTCIKIWDLESKSIVAELVPENKKSSCISLAWSADGSTLYSGYTDNIVRVWGVYSSAK